MRGIGKTDLGYLRMVTSKTLLSLRFTWFLRRLSPWPAITYYADHIPFVFCPSVTVVHVRFPSTVPQ